MKKIIKSLIPLLIFATSVFADHSTDKTFLMPRPQGVNLAMEYTTWNKYIQKQYKFRGGTALAATSFYQESNCSENLGKYFGIKHHDYIKFNEKADDDTADINLRYILHDYNYEANPRFGKTEFSPNQRTFGIRVDLYQDLKEIAKGFYLKATLPFVYVQNNMRLSIEDVDTTSGRVSTKQILANFFAGNYSVLNDMHTQPNAQFALDAAKFNGAHSKSGLADLDFVFGYRFLERKRGFAALNLGLTIPLGNTVEGTHLFEPVYGNGNHWGLGVGFDSKVKFFKHKDSYFKLMLVLNYRYLFEGTEKRTLGLKNKHFGQYFLVGKDGDWAGRPAANVTTKTLEVTPGSQIDGLAGFAYKNGGWVLDLGYNIFWKDSENLSLKEHWKNNQYALVALNKNFTDGALGTGATDYDDGDGTSVAFADAYKLNKTNLDFEAATNPSYLTHKIYGGCGYIFKRWKNEVMVGVGGSYEFANSNNELENWAVWFKGGINF
jgi:hypothetical protein